MKWIKLALEDAGIVTISLLPHGIVASMNWHGLAETISGQPTMTIEDALESLNDALEDNAGEEQP